MNVTIKGSSIKKSKVVGRDDNSDNNTNIYSETKKVAMKTSIVVSLIVGIIASLIASYVFNKYIMSESKQNNQVVEACSPKVDNQEQHTN